MLPAELASLISVRNFLSSCIDNLNITLTKLEIKQIQEKIVSLDKFIIKESLSMDLSKLSDKFYFKAESTEDTKTVLEKFSNESSV